MGNSLIPNTNVNKDPVGNSGVNNQWQMYEAVRTDKTKDKVTVFLFDKKSISKLPSGKEEFISVLKREPEILGKFQHSGILKLMDAVIEDPKRIGFTSERVVSSLSHLIAINKVHDIIYSDLDLKLHILDLAETLSYLHREVKAAHLSISPENIYIMPDGKWKLSGFSFSTQLLHNEYGESKADFTQKPGQIRLTPSLRFTAPEVTQTPSICSFTSDMFSLGCLIYTLYKIRNDNGTHDPYLIQVNSLHGYSDAIKNVSRGNFLHIPTEIRSDVIGMLNHDPALRISSTDFVNQSWFQDPFIQTVKVLENIHQKDFTQQQNFLKSLCMIILKFEASFIQRRIIPILNNLVKSSQLTPSVLPIYFKIMEPQNPPYLNREEFNTLIWPSIKPILSGSEISAQTLYILLQQMELFVGHLEIKEIQTVFVPLLIKSFECGVQKLQDLALTQSLFIFDKIDYVILKNQILPKILALCTDANVDLRKGAIIMISKTLHVFDSAVINNQILHMLDSLRKLNNNYAIHMAMMSIYQGIMDKIAIDIIANRILVSLMPMLVYQNISKAEYNAILSTIHGYLKKVEDEQGQRFQGMPDQPPEEIQKQKLEQTFNAQIQSPAELKGENNAFTGDFAFLNSNMQKPSTQNPTFNSNVPEVNMSDFKDWNQRPAEQMMKNQQQVAADSSKSFNVDWNSFSAPTQQQTNPNQNKNPWNVPNMNNPSNMNAFPSSNLAQSAMNSNNPFGNAAQKIVQNEVKKEIAQQSSNFNNPNNSGGGFDAFNSFNQMNFGNQQNKMSQQNQQQYPRQMNQQQQQWNPQKGMQGSASSQQQNWGNQNQFGNQQQQPRSSNQSYNPNQSQTGQQQGQGQNNNYQNQNSYRQPDNYNYNNSNNNYNNNNNNNKNNSSNNPQGSTGDNSYNYTSNSEAQQEKPETETKPVITGNNPLRYINTGAGMSSIRGKR